MLIAAGHCPRNTPEPGRLRKTDVTEGVLGSFCNYWNDADHSRGFELTRVRDPAHVPGTKTSD